DRQQRAERARRRVEFVPERVRSSEQAQLVFSPEDEIVVRIRADADARRCRAKASERRQSSLVIVEKSGLPAGFGELSTADAGWPAGKRVSHAGLLLMINARPPLPRSVDWQPEVVTGCYRLF